MGSLGYLFPSESIQKQASEIQLNSDYLLLNAKKSILFSTLKTWNQDYNSLYSLQGEIATAAEFPTTANVKTGYTYVITATVTDNDATKTNTGLTFETDDIILWNGSTWKSLQKNSIDSFKVSKVYSPDGSIEVFLTDNDGNSSVSGKFTVWGDFHVEGKKVINDSEETRIKDNVLLLNSGEIGSGITKGFAGLIFDKGLQVNYGLIYNQSNNYMRAGDFMNLDGTAQGGNDTEIILDADASAIDDTYNNKKIVLFKEGETTIIRTISDYTGSTKTATVASLGITPDNTWSYEIQAVTDNTKRIALISDSPTSTSVPYWNNTNGQLESSGMLYDAVNDSFGLGGITGSSSYTIRVDGGIYNQNGDVQLVNGNMYFQYGLGNTLMSIRYLLTDKVLFNIPDNKILEIRSTSTAEGNGYFYFRDGRLDIAKTNIYGTTDGLINFSGVQTSKVFTSNVYNNIGVTGLGYIALEHVATEGVQTATFKTSNTDGVAVDAQWIFEGRGVKTSYFESTISTGTAPLTVASTTLVTNLNADKVDGYDVQTLLIDTNDRLMRVGAFGLGATNITPQPDTDFSTVTYANFRKSTSATNPFGAYGSGLYMPYGASGTNQPRGAEIFFSSLGVATGKFWFRTQYDGVSYLREVYHSANSNLSTVDWNAKIMDATAYEVGGEAGVSFSGAVTNITVINGIVTAVS